MSHWLRTLEGRIIMILVGLNVFAWFWANFNVWRISVAVERIGQQPTTGRNSAGSDAPGPVVDVRPGAGLNVPGIDNPKLCQADDVELGDRERVIGVEIDGQSRAYVIGAFEVHRVSQPRDLAVHIVNDDIAGQPIIVTHCDRTHSTRVLKAAEPVNIGVGGWDSGLVLVVDGDRYPHHAPTIPLADVEFVITSWSEWSSDHPDTLVYTGDVCGS